MHHLPVQRNGSLGEDDRELLELCAEGWSAPVIANILTVEPEELRERMRGLCERLGIVPRADGHPPVHAARLWLVNEAREAAFTPRAA
jgi:hypothetical protein